jgi:hypothetical protein
MTYASAVEKLNENISEIMELSALLIDHSPEHLSPGLIQLRRYMIMAEQAMKNFGERVEVGVGAKEI